MNKEPLYLLLAWAMVPILVPVYIRGVWPELRTLGADELCVHVLALTVAPVLIPLYYLACWNCHHGGDPNQSIWYAPVTFLRLLPSLAKG